MEFEALFKIKKIHLSRLNYGKSVCKFSLHKYVIYKIKNNDDLKLKINQAAAYPGFSDVKRLISTFMYMYGFIISVVCLACY